MLGVDDPDALISVYCLAYLLEAKKTFQDAIAFYQRARDGYNKALGIDHPTTVACEGHLSSL